MKIRQGFVSNSSSTSFLVAWERRITCLEDILPWVSNRAYAQRLLEKTKSQEAVFLCEPPKDHCETCEERFRCYTGSGAFDSLKRLRYRGWEDWEIEDLCGFEDLEQFAKANKNRFIYKFRIMDGGEGGDEIESNMRGDYLWSKLPKGAVEDVT